jgi:hypothetical protein
MAILSCPVPISCFPTRSLQQICCTSPARLDRKFHGVRRGSLGTRRPGVRDRIRNWLDSRKRVWMKRSALPLVRGVYGRVRPYRMKKNNS